MIDKCKGMTEDDYMPVPDDDSDMLAYDSGGSMGGGGSEPDLAGEEMQEMILDMFLRADDDGNGYLDRGEFKRVLRDSDLKLTKKDIRNVMAECDENDDGVIEYREFMPIMVDLIGAARARDEAEAQREMDEMDAQFEAEDFFLRGMSQEELEGIMKKIFLQHDADGNGILDRDEFKACLKSSDLGLTRKEINMLLSEADENADGVIEYEEFAPLCFRILVEKFKEDYLQTKALQEAGELESVMLDSFAEKGMGDNGKLTRKQVKKVFEEISYDFLGLTRVQIVTVMSMAEADGQSMVDVPKFVRSAAQMIFKMMDTSKAADKAKAMETLAKTDGAEMLHGMTGDEIKEALQGAFNAVDSEGKGWLTPEEVYDVLRMMGTDSLSLSEYEMNSLMAAVDENDDGMVEWEELVDFMYDVLMHLDRNQYVDEVAQDNEYDDEEEGEY
jgi:Ca2+-binding EF-hand superfamily protein